MTLFIIVELSWFEGDACDRYITNHIENNYTFLLRGAVIYSYELTVREQKVSNGVRRCG